MAEIRLIEAVVRALDILELLDQEGELGITDIARRLHMEKSTVYRALSTLRARRYVNQDPESLRYSNSYKLFEMGHNVVRRQGWPKLASPFLRQLAQATPGSVNLGLRDGLKVVYIDKVESEELVKVCLKTGQCIPLYCTGLGKALLAFWADWKLEDLLGPEEPFTRFTPTTLTTLAELRADLAEVRRRGYSLDNEEHMPGVVCVAAPAFNAKGEAVAALSVAVPRSFLETRVTVEALGQAVFTAAEGLTSSLGGHRPSAY